MQRTTIFLILIVATACQPASVTTLVFDGNSLTYGVGATPNNSYPEQVMRLLPESYRSRNLAVSAQSTSDMLRDAATQVDALARSQSTNILVVWEGTNDLYFGATPADAIANLTRYCKERRTAGYRIVLLTLLPRSGPGTPANFSADSQSVNAALRADWQSFADVLVDVAADMRLTNEADQTYFVDRVHLTDAGYAIVAAHVASAIRNLQGQ